jgi:hypothetical protein
MSRFSFIVVVTFFIAACSSTSPVTEKQVNSQLSRLGKGDIDEVVELHQKHVLQQLKTLMIKLYKRNPTHRHDKLQRDIEQSVELVFKYPDMYYFPQWQEKTSTDLVRLSLSDEFQGKDRVLPFIVGLRTMLMASYDNRTEFYLFTKVDEQKLYNSARNIEIAAWLLADRRDKDGDLYILSDSLAAETRNLSYQRLIGQMIATQENLAYIIAQKTGRLIKTVVVKTASMMFLPI